VVAFFFSTNSLLITALLLPPPQFRHSCARHAAKTWKAAFGNETDATRQLLDSYRQRTAGKDEAKMMADAAAAMAKV
jgi:hypothetical protein